MENHENSLYILLSTVTQKKNKDYFLCSVGGTLE